MGDKQQRLCQAIAQLASYDLTILKVSSLYETAPVDYLDQDWFYNAVIEIETARAPLLLINDCQEIEKMLGKAIEIPKGPRTIDLDILFYGDQTIVLPHLMIPHPSALKRLFVLAPMAEIAPGFIPPNDHRTIQEIVSHLEGATVVRKKTGPEWAGKVAPH